MTKNNFYEQQLQSQIVWRKNNISTVAQGYQNKRQYEHVIPRTLWKETLWQGIREDLPDYLSLKKIQSHTGVHNLLSSWVVCANLYYIVRINDGFKKLMLGFLREHVSGQITRIKETELEFAFDGKLSPANLLGEQDGNRGSGQTSPDVAFMVETNAGEGVILTECKYTEHSFYRCSARRTTNGPNSKVANPAPNRCMQVAQGYDYKAVCHQTVWQRKYWEHLTLSDYGKSNLKRCPASTAGYQLFRQQSLAEAISATNRYDLVVTSVAFDGRNQSLIKCMRATGVPDFTSGWANLFTGKALFKTWTHQQWVEYVRQNAKDAMQKEWAEYMNSRYGY